MLLLLDHSQGGPSGEPEMRNRSLVQLSHVCAGPCTQVGAPPEEAQRPWLWIGSALAIAVTWRNGSMERRSFSLSHHLSLDQALH